MKRPSIYRQKALYAALVVAIALLIFDRSAAYLFLPGKDSTQIIIYTTETCPYCRRLRAYLAEQKIAYTDRNIYKTPSGIMGFWILRGRGVPVSVVGPDIIHGYDINKLEESLTELGYKLNTTDHNNKLNPDAAENAESVN